MMDPHRDAVYLESGGSSQHDDVGAFPEWFEGLPAVSSEENLVSWLVLMWRCGRASLVDGVEARPNVLMCPLQIS